jgi:hypothetical protein
LVLLASCSTPAPAGPAAAPASATSVPAQAASAAPPAASPDAVKAVAALEELAGKADCAGTALVPSIDVARRIDADPALAARRQKAVEAIAAKSRTCPP